MKVKLLALALVATTVSAVVDLIPSPTRREPTPTATIALIGTSVWPPMPTVLQQLRASRWKFRVPLPKVVHHQQTAVVHHVVPSLTQRVAVPRISGSAASWAHSYFAVRVANCESGGGPNDHHAYYDGNPHVRGFYSGKWQMDPDFWRSYGGLAYASSPADAPEAAQDAVAYRGYRARGWRPWQCAGMV